MVWSLLRPGPSLAPMERSKVRVWARRILVALTVVWLVVSAGVSWRMMSIIESDLLSPGSIQDPVTLDVVGVEGSRITFVDTDSAAVEGIWGIRGANGYGQVTRVISRGSGGVERGLALLSGSLVPGETVAVDVYAFPGDPRAAHGLPFEEVRVPGELGVNPAWLIDGLNDTWIVFVHGKEVNGRAQSLRALPTFRKLGFPVLVITYRNDASGAAGDGGRYSWGLDEWRDLEAALETAKLRGADDFILVGHDMGASIVTMFLHESDQTADVRAVVFDSPLLDLEALVDDLAEDRGIPGYLAVVGKALTRIRHGLEWSRLDQTERVGEFDPSLPVLLMAGTADELAPISIVDAFAAALPNATYERFVGAAHGALWNSEPVRYEDSLTAFLIEVTPEIAPEG